MAALKQPILLICFNFPRCSIMNQECTECDRHPNAKDKVDQEQSWESAERTFHLGVFSPECAVSGIQFKLMSRDNSGSLI